MDRYPRKDRDVGCVVVLAIVVVVGFAVFWMVTHG